MEWSEEEINSALNAYLEMLEAEMEGRAFVKADFNRSVSASTGRSRGSVEFKFANISAVLQDLGLPWIEGYKPRSNYQLNLRTAIERRLAAGGEFIPRQTPDAPGVTESVAGEATTTTVDRVRTYEDGLRAVPERSFGGAGVAVRPDDWPPDPFWPSGPSSPAADELLAWMKARTPEADQTILAFLVGGPGNGKSFLSSNFVDGMKEIDPVADGLAHRTYRYRVGGRDLVLVNDATIHRFDAKPSPLVADVGEAIEEPHHLLANVNRGILYEELSKAQGWSPGRMVVRWLEGTTPDDSNGWHVDQLQDERYFRSALLVAPSGETALLVSVNMDVCSLFERRPEIEFNHHRDGIADKTERYRIERLSRRDDQFSDHTPGGALIKAFVAGFPALPEQSFLDPFAANIESLASPKVRTGVCTILRGAEIASSKQLTYRELWGAISLLVVGDLPERFPRTDPLLWMKEHQPRDKSVLQRLKDVAALAEMRFHQALFRARPFFAGEPSAASSPVTRLTELVDPVTDARPGKRLASGAGWADPVLDAFASQTLGESPLDGLRRNVDDDDAVLEAITDIEIALDTTIAEALESGDLKDSQRRALMSWYGEYLLRLYASANGLPAFFEELDTWTRIWRAAHNRERIPQDAEKAIHTLLLPALDPNEPGGSLVLPIYDARTVPVSESVEEPKLATELSPQRWELDCREDGDQLFVQLQETAEPVVELELDFPVLREAMSCQVGHIGITEFANIASPRLERFRAALLNPLKTRHARAGIVTGSSFSAIEIGAD